MTSASRPFSFARGDARRVVFLDYLRIFAFVSVLVGHKFAEPLQAAMAEVRAIYAELDQRPLERQCRLSGQCCQFRRSARQRCCHPWYRRLKKHCPWQAFS